MKTGLWFAAGMVCLCAGISGKAFSQARPPSLFTISKVKVRAEAADAVQAKQLAVVQGQREALRRLMKRLTGFRSYNRLPQLDDTTIERMVDGMQVRSERNSGTVYLATLDYAFEAKAVKDILNRFGLAYVTERAPEIVMLPVYIEAGTARQAAQNPWYEALRKADLQNTLTPVKLVAPRPDVTADMAARIAADPARGMETLTYQYRAQYLVMAVAEIDAQTQSLQVRYVGRDAAGLISLSRSFKIYAKDVDATTEKAAQISLNMIEGRWKLTKLASLGALDGPQELVRLELTAQFTGLKEWQSIKQRLARVPGVQGLEVKALNPRSASISIEFPGGGERLVAAAASQGLAVEGSADAWLVRAQ